MQALVSALVPSTLSSGSIASLPTFAPATSERTPAPAIPASIRDSLARVASVVNFRAHDIVIIYQERIDHTFALSICERRSLAASFLERTDSEALVDIGKQLEIKRQVAYVVVFADPHGEGFREVTTLVLE